MCNKQNYIKLKVLPVDDVCNPECHTQALNAPGALRVTANLLTNYTAHMTLKCNGVHPLYITSLYVHYIATYNC